MHPIEATFGIISLITMFPGAAILVVATIVSLFKIYEADRYYGVGRMAEKPFFHLKGLPFSLWRMTEYSWLLLEIRTRYGQRRYARELELISDNPPPKSLERLLLWLYASWSILVAIGLFSGGVLVLFF